MTSKTKEILREWLWADYQLYTYFKEKFEKTIRQIDTTYLQSEMEQLQYLNNNLKEKCQAEVVDNESLKGMAIPVVEFSSEVYKIRKFFWLKINCSQMKLPNLEKWNSV